MKSSTALYCAAFVVLHAASSISLAQGHRKDQAFNPVLSIQLERTPCEGSCPVYNVVLKPGGFLKYHGLISVERTGDWKARYWGAEFDRLVTFINDHHFYRMKRTQEYVTDAPSTIVTVTRRSGTKSVEMQFESQDLWAIGTLIDGIVNHADGWYQVGSLKPPKLKLIPTERHPPLTRAKK